MLDHKKEHRSRQGRIMPPVKEEQRLQIVAMAAGKDPGDFLLLI